MRKLIFDNASQIDIKNQAIKNGMTQLRDAGIGKIKSGVTTIEEVLRATVEDN
jgi:type IV pilus assembly protein PilB